MYVRYVLVQYGAVCYYRRLCACAYYSTQEHKKRVSTEFNLVTAQNTAHRPPEDGRIYGPKHVGESS